MPQGCLEDDACHFVATKDLSRSYASKSFDVTAFKNFWQTLKSLPGNKSLLAAQKKLEQIMADLEARTAGAWHSGDDTRNQGADIEK